jgi:LmbE family N-acetylglucosaminyl deacetylase
MERILVLAPHADDAEFGLGGTLHKLAADPAVRIKVVIFAWGNYRHRNGHAVTGETRRAETAAAMAILGVEDYTFLQAFSENQALQAEYPAIVRHIDRALKEFQPDTVFTCLPSFNQDHEVLHKATLTAFRPGAADAIARLYAYEYPGNVWGPESPGWGRVYVRLGAPDMAAKTNALWAHTSQFGTQFASFATGLIHPEGAAILAHLRGMAAGCRQAELVFLIRELI